MTEGVDGSIVKGAASLGGRGEDGDDDDGGEETGDVNSRGKAETVKAALGLFQGAASARFVEDICL